MISRGRLIALVVVGGVGLLGGVLTGMVRRTEPPPVTRIELRSEPTSEPDDNSRADVVDRQRGPESGVRRSDADEDDISEGDDSSDDDGGEDDSSDDDGGEDDSRDDDGGEGVEAREDDPPVAQASAADEDDISDGDDSSVDEGGDDSSFDEGDDD